MFSLTIAEVFPALRCIACFQQQSFHMMWFADTSAWEHRDVTARPRTLTKRTLIYPFNVNLCSQTLTCLVQLSEPETQTGKAHPRSILLFTLRWFNLFPCSSCRYCARNSSLEESEQVAQGKTSTHLNTKHLLFTLFLLQRNGVFFPFAFLCCKSRRYPMTTPSKGLGALSSQRRVKTEHPPWLNIELWKTFISGTLDSHCLTEKGFGEDSDQDLPKVPLHSTHSPYTPCEGYSM